MTCDANKFNTDGVATNGCEVGCATVTDGTCTACTTPLASGCSAVTCNANKFDTNGNANDGCEAGCATVTRGTCTACSSVLTSGCTAVTCESNYEDANNDATDGCTLVVSVLVVQVKTGPSASDWEGGKCSHIGAGWVVITDQAECQQALETLGLVETAGADQLVGNIFANSVSGPPGCFWSSGTFWLNTLTEDKYNYETANQAPPGRTCGHNHKCACKKI